jgi:tight adherence protein C
VDANLALILGLAGVFLALVISLATVGVMTSERQQVSRSLAAVNAISSRQSPMAQRLNKPFAERVIEPALARFTEIGRRLAPGDQGARIRHRLELAGSPVGWDVDRVIALKVLGLLAGLSLGIALPLLMGGGFLVVVGVAILFGVTGFFAPNLALYQMTYNRTEQMRRELPDALDLLTISVEAGLAFDAGLSQVARNTTGPLADEFFRVLQEMQIGLGRSEALRALGERTELPELRGFVTAMVQADAFGIPIAAVLRVQAREMRIKRSQRAEELAQKVPVKILFPLIFCILPALFVVILGPAAITIFHSFSGRLG